MAGDEKPRWGGKLRWGSKLRWGGVVLGLGAVVSAAVLGYELLREAETSLAGVRTSASVLEVGTATSTPRYLVVVDLAGSRREVWTSWLPDGTVPGATVDVVVNRRDPDHVVGAGTRGDRALHYFGLMALTGFLVLMAAGLRRAGRPPGERRPPRFVVPVRPNRAERRARRRRGKGVR